MTFLIDSRVLLSKPDMEAFENALKKMGKEGEELIKPAVDAIRKSMEVSIKRVFWIAAIASLFSFLLIITIPEVPIGRAEDM
jgi:hypothetical protein